MFNSLKNKLAQLHNDDTGAMSVEKVLILAVIALPILILLFAFRKTIMGWFTEKSSQLDDS